MKADKHTNKDDAESSISALPAWWLYFTRELTDLWIGGKALILIFIYSILLGVISFVMASNSELSLIPPKEMVFEVLKIAIAIGGFIGLIIGSDSISGERERSTLEWLLLAPTSRRQLIFGKYLAAISPWPAAMLVTIPTLWLLSQGDEVFAPAVIWGAVFGTLLTLALTGLGMLVSFWSNSNKTSYFVSLGIYLLVLVPTQLPGSAQTGAMGKLLKQLSPMEATYHFLEKILVNNRTIDELLVFILAPALFAAVILILLIGYAAPRLRLEAGTGFKFGFPRGRVVGIFIIACVLFSLVSVAPVFASQQNQAEEGTLQVTIDEAFASVNAGDPISYNTTITNNGTEESPALIAAMNIINLDSEGDVVDPEDWSPERTQYIESIGPGESTDLSWRVNAVLEGDYMIYTVIIPEPESEDETSQPLASSGIHVTVIPFTNLNPSGILPYAIGLPIFLLLVILIVYWLRRRGLDTGAVNSNVPNPAET